MIRSTFIREKILSYFVICILLPELPIYLLGVWFFDKFENKVLSQF